ncbi:TPA: hypothetical protein ACSQFP_000980 [Pseudomonas aeruginosa]|uniref:hypothetical protein n=1 Tax=Pseudomonas TaxID=286 RepID=UPI000F52E7DB|nr:MULTISPECIES: hypothetical protein [Pseudomonas]EIW4145348.1 hypothetical protein [Pseudomonas aeruginosa]EKU5857910.1 hypothetical protein [Pseudomonas aeruginosa]EMB0804794.1 hypothetical protein [Pseudomonas aeruginosa]KAA5591901.1 hypothetical protein F3H14_14640 [Pseudomonas aeruginosa]KAA5617329.1 hypothetical protein F3H15_16235 [Pseudomonas aeruginosa]
MQYEYSVYRKTILLGLIVFAISGCKTQDYVPAIAGTAIGGAICNQIYKGKKIATVTALCAAGGYLIADTLTKYLTEREKDQLQTATHTTLNTGESQVVKTESGATIKTEVVAAPAKDQITSVVKSPAPKTTPSEQQEKNPPATASKDDCREVKQTIITNDNQRYEDTINACRQGETWVIS